jgi:hypothetical protein
MFEKKKSSGVPRGESMCIDACMLQGRKFQIACMHSGTPADIMGTLKNASMRHHMHPFEHQRKFQNACMLARPRP